MTMSNTETHSTREDSGSAEVRSAESMLIDQGAVPDLTEASLPERFNDLPGMTLSEVGDLYSQVAAAEARAKAETDQVPEILEALKRGQPSAELAISPQEVFSALVKEGQDPQLVEAALSEKYFKADQVLAMLDEIAAKKPSNMQVGYYMMQRFHQELKKSFSSMELPDNLVGFKFEGPTNTVKATYTSPIWFGLRTKTTDRVVANFFSEKNEKTGRTAIGISIYDPTVLNVYKKITTELMPLIHHCGLELAQPEYKFFNRELMDAMLDRVS